MRTKLKVVSSAVAAAAAAALVLLVTPATANAATGTFSYDMTVFGATQRATLDNPPNDECFDLDDGEEPATNAENNTDANAVLYENPDCTMQVEFLPPGTSDTRTFNSFTSVRFEAVVPDDATEVVGELAGEVATVPQAAPDNDVAILVCSVPQGIGAPDNAVTDTACVTS